MTEASAPGKVILFGEHAVVYGYPAIAAPVSQVRATARVVAGAVDGVRIVARDLGETYWLAQAPQEDPLAAAVRLVQATLALPRLPNLTISVRSNIPIASGMGSGAATTAALIRALLLHLERPDLAQAAHVSDLTYEIEKIHHGTPSGIDNTVVTFEKPVYFVRRQPENLVETFPVAQPLHLLIGDTGVRSSTRDVVGDVRRQWQADPARFQGLFAACGRIAEAARQAIEAGKLNQLGVFMQENQAWLREMSVSAPELEWLVETAVAAGALGAKLSGAGRGGNMIALVMPEQEEAVRAALLAAGAHQVLASTVR